MDFGLTETQLSLRQLTETQLSLRQLAHEFAEKEIRPLARGRERIRDPRERFPWDILEKGSKLGLRTLSLPEERGGAGASILDLCIVGEEIAWGDLGVAVTFDQTWKIIHFLDRVWNEEQRARFLPAFLGDHRFHLAVGVTEPDVGSENFTPSDSPGDGVRLRGVREGDHWVLNGMKHFISNGGIAKLYVIVTRTDPKAAVARGVTYFMVTPGTKGFSIGEIHDKMGQRLSQNAELIFENCRVPDADRVTEVGGGVKARAGSFSRGSVIESAATAPPPWGPPGRLTRMLLNTRATASRAESPSSSTRRWASCWPTASSSTRPRARPCTTRPGWP
ncbi:MAG: acyl-CoA dehydrogenase family protein [Candidatus Tectomicrobia bacterium]|nr:acyl-CoA dehydrogenase family protein [Candidatus Tectomicrobia bacterium]